MSGFLSQKLLVLNPRAGSLDEEALKRLRGALAGFEELSVDDDTDLAAELGDPGLAADALVVVAGGDGTVGAAARALTGSRRMLGIVPLGTFNNFARGLGIPLELEPALAALREGRPRTVTVGRVNGRPFLEVAALGLFGELLGLGEAAKELRYGDVLERVRSLRAGRFIYRVSGDVALRGRARSVIAANTPSTGALVPLAEVTPRDAFLELSAEPAGLLNRIRRRRPHRIRSARIETDPPVAVFADAEPAGESPAEISLDPDGLRVILPSAQPS